MSKPAKKPDRQERLAATLLPVLADWVDDLNVSGSELYALMLTLATRTAHTEGLSLDDVKRGLTAAYADLPILVDETGQASVSGGPVN